MEMKNYQINRIKYAQDKNDANPQLELYLSNVDDDGEAQPELSQPMVVDYQSTMKLLTFCHARPNKNAVRNTYTIGSEGNDLENVGDETAFEYPPRFEANVAPNQSIPEITDVPVPQVGNGTYIRRNDSQHHLNDDYLFETETYWDNYTNRVNYNKGIPSQVKSFIKEGHQDYDDPIEALRNDVASETEANRLLGNAMKTERESREMYPFMETHQVENREAESTNSLLDDIDNANKTANQVGEYEPKDPNAEKGLYY